MDGRITPTGTYQIGRADQVRPAMRVRPIDSAPPIARIEPVARRSTSGVSRLVAGTVGGRIDFSGEQPAQDPTALAMYRHPADRNAAATAVGAGRLIDVTG